MRELTGHNYRREVRETQRGNIGDVVAEDGDFLVQCKVGKTPPIWKALPEAEEANVNREELLLPIACVHRNQRDGGPPEMMVLMRPWVFCWLLRKSVNKPRNW
jgi:hypothetical protein